MSNSYNVDDILAEIKRKKSQNADISNVAVATKNEANVKSNKAVEKDVWDRALANTSSINIKKEFNIPKPTKSIPPLPTVNLETKHEQQRNRIFQKQQDNQIFDGTFTITIKDGDLEQAAESYVDDSNADFYVPSLEGREQSLFGSMVPDKEPIRESPKSNRQVFEDNRQVFEEKRQQQVEQFFADDEVLEFDAIKNNLAQSGDYNSKTEAFDPVLMSQDLAKSKLTLIIQIVFSVIGAGLLFYLHLSKVHMLILPKALYPEEQPQLFMVVNLLILLVVTIVCSTTIGSGLVSLFTLKADNDSLVAIATIAAIAQSVFLVIKPEFLADSHTALYLFLPAFSMIFISVGKIINIVRISENLKMLQNGFKKTAALIVGEHDSARELTRGLNLDNSCTVGYTAKTASLSNFEELCQTDDYGERFAKSLAPVCLIFSLATAIASYFLTKSVTAALTTFAVATAICAPFSLALSCNLPMLRMTKKLTKNGVMVAGCDSVDEYSKINSVVVNATDLFTPYDVVLYNVKTFADKRIDEALIDAASVICVSNSTLAEIFKRVIQNQTKLLRPVDNLTFEDNMGLSAWVGKRRILIGNRGIMQHYGIDIPSKDYEQKFVKGDRNILYLATSGELTAMFVVGYNSDSDIIAELDRLVQKNIGLVVNTSDPNITPEKISQLFNFPVDMVKILPSKLKNKLSLLNSKKSSTKADMSFIGPITTFFRGLFAVQSTRTTMAASTIIQLVGIILGYAIVVFFGLSGSITSLTPDALLIYQFLWLLVVIILPFVKKI